MKISEGKISNEKINTAIKRSKVSLEIAILALDASEIDEKVSERAIDRLCKINSPVTSNILNLVVSYKKAEIFACYGRGEHFGQSIYKTSYGVSHAKAELARRGNPPYNPAAYY